MMPLGIPTDVSDAAGFGYRYGRMTSIGGLVIHHTGDNHSQQQGIDDAWASGLGAQYRMDRDGNIIRMAPEGAVMQHMQPGSGLGRGRNNGNMEGIEIAAKSDADITPAQRDALRAFVGWHSQQYGYNPTQNVFGHSEVNPGHRENEGAQFAQGVRSGDISLNPSGDTAMPPAPIGQRWASNVGTDVSAQPQAPSQQSLMMQQMMPFIPGASSPMVGDANRGGPPWMQGGSGPPMTGDANPPAATPAPQQPVAKGATAQAQGDSGAGSFWGGVISPSGSLTPPLASTMADTGASGIADADHQALQALQMQGRQQANPQMLRQLAAAVQQLQGRLGTATGATPLGMGGDAGLGMPGTMSPSSWGGFL